jgi:antitoxin Phd
MHQTAVVDILTSLTRLLVMPKHGRWTLQDAKAQFSELVRRTLASGPQTVTRNGHDAVVIVSVDQYRRLAARHAGGGQPRSLARFLAASPLGDVTLEIARPRTSGRDIDL